MIINSSFFTLHLPKRICQQFDFYLRTYSLVEYVIHSIENGHVYVHAAINLLHTLGAEESLCYHLHLYLCALHALSLTYHGAEGAVAREVAVAGNKQVAEIY